MPSPFAPNRRPTFTELAAGFPEAMLFVVLLAWWWARGLLFRKGPRE